MQPPTESPKFGDQQLVECAGVVQPDVHPLCSFGEQFDCAFSMEQSRPPIWRFYILTVWVGSGGVRWLGRSGMCRVWCGWVGLIYVGWGRVG